MSREFPTPRESRIKAKFDVLYSLGKEEGAGLLVDLSYTGARFENPSIVPPLGTEVRIYVFVMPVDPFQLSGRVVRHTETGFAIEYEELDDAAKRLVDDASALV